MEISPLYEDVYQRKSVEIDRLGKEIITFEEWI